ncbi:MAG TPA: hypothetical protein VF323_04935, partial [Candidatus Limnocylindrales bacterium]
MAGPSARTSRDTEPQDRRIRRTWWALSASFLILAILAAARLVLDHGQPADWLVALLVTLGGFAAVLHREAVRGREMGRRGEAESVARILQGLSRSMSPDAIVEAIVDELDVETGADHTVVVRLQPETRMLEATLVSRRPGVPSSRTILPATDLEMPIGGRGLDLVRDRLGERLPVAVPIGGSDLAPVATGRFISAEASYGAPTAIRPRARSQAVALGRRTRDLGDADRRAPERRGADRRRSWPALDAIASIRAFVAGNEGSDAAAIPIAQGPAARVADRLAERVRET